MAFAWFARAITGGAVTWSSDAAAAALVDDDAPCIFFANHTSHADMVLVWSSLPCSLRKRTRPVAAKDYWTGGPLRRHFGIGVFRSVLVERGCVPGTIAEDAAARGSAPLVARDVDAVPSTATPATSPMAGGNATATQVATTQRVAVSSVAGDFPDPREVPPAVQCMIDALDDGDSLILFPEGTRGDGAEIAKFKSGLYHLAMARPDVRLVPVNLQNLNRVLPKGEVVPIPFLSRMIVGEPQRILPGEDRRAFLDRMRGEVEALGEL